ncbi:LysR family transcriptional regulator [Salinisphaera sp. Q1T1-3]|nr:LysR family transcriptional regulator [Salinisphaera sp. Q1T1-3]
MHTRAESLLDQFDQLDHVFHHAEQRPQGRIRLNAPYAFGTAYLGTVLAGYRARYPSVELDVVLADRRVGLIEEGYDLALRIGELEDSSLVARRLGRLGMHVVASPDYIAQHGEPRHPHDLTDHHCLTYSHPRHGLEWPFWDGDRWLRVRTRPGLRANNGNVLCDIAVAGGGITMQPDFIVGPALEDKRLIRLLTDYRPPDLSLNAVYPERTLMPARLRGMLDHLAETFALLRDEETGLIRRPRQRS